MRRLPPSADVSTFVIWNVAIGAGATEVEATDRPALPQTPRELDVGRHGRRRQAEAVHREMSGTAIRPGPPDWCRRATP